MIKSASETRERRIHRENMGLYVFMPSRDAAAASLLIGLGIATVIVAVYAMSHSQLVAAFFFIVGMGSLFCGAGWLMMIRARLDAYRDDIMNALTIDQSNVTEHDDGRPSGERPIPVTTNGRTQQIPLREYNPLKEDEWRKLAHGIIRGGMNISQVSLARQANLISQPRYEMFANYMTGAKYMQVVRGKNELTANGEAYLRQWLE